MTIAAHITETVDTLTEALGGVDVHITADITTAIPNLAAGTPIVYVTPPAITWETWDHHTYTTTAWIIAPTLDPTTAITHLDPILTALADVGPQSATPDTFELTSGRSFAGYTVTI